MIGRKSSQTLRDKKQIKNLRNRRERKLLLEQLEDRRMLAVLYVDYSSIGDNGEGAGQFTSDGQAPVTGLTLDTNLFTTISAAVAAANNGDIIRVADGTYNEDVLVNKHLTIVAAAGAASTFINGATAGYGGAVRFTIGSSGSTFGGAGLGFTVQDTAGAQGAAVYIEAGTSDLLIEGNVLVSGSGQNALLTEHSQRNHTIRGNTFSGTGAQLVYVNGAASHGFANASNNVNFINNAFSGEAPTGPLLGQEAASSEISGNHFSGSSNYAAVELWGGANEVTNNIFGNPGTGPALLIVTNASSTGGGFASDNAFLGAATVEIENNTNQSFPANNNWWGSVVEADVTGSVSERVTIASFLLAGDEDDGPTNGFQVDTAAGVAVTSTAGPGGLQAAIDAATSGSTLNVPAGIFSGITIDKPLTLVGAGIGQTTITGGSPALTVSNAVSLSGMSYTTSTNDPTILIQSGGSLTLRSSEVDESTGSEQVAIRIESGGGLDLGTTGNPGSNIININGAGRLIDNLDNDAAPALGNTWQKDASTIDNFTIEDRITHAMDNANYGLVTWVADNVYVTTSSLGIQRGIDLASATNTVNVATGTYSQAVDVNKQVTVALAGSVTINSLTGIANATVNLGAAANNLTLGDASNTIFPGLLQGSGSLTKTGAGTFTLSNANTYTGPTTIDAGTLVAANSTALNTSAVTVNAATLQIASVSINSGNRPDILLNNGATLLGTGTASYTKASNPVIASGATVTFATSGAGDTLTIGSGYQNASSSSVTPTIHVAGPGRVNLDSGSNSFRANWNLQSGTVRAAVQNSFGNPTVSGSLTGSTVTLSGASLEVRSTGNILFDGNSGTAVPVAVTADTTINQVRTNAGEGFEATFGALTMIGTRQLTLGTSTNINANTAYGFTFGATSLAAGNDTFAINNNGTAAGTLTLGPVSESSTAGLTKTGIGTLVMTGASSYTGATTVSSGTLLVNGSTAAGSAVTVENGATLGGIGTVGGSINVASGGTVAPGISPGTLNGGSVAFDSGSNFNLELNGATVGGGYDQLNVTGTVNLGGATLNISLGFTPSVGAAFTIVDNDESDAITATFAGLAEGTTFLVGATMFQITYQGGDGNDLVLTTLDPNNPILSGTPGNDTFVVTRSGADTQVSLNSNVIYSGAPTSLTINGLAGNDTLTVDFSDGNPIPSGGLSFNGAGQATAAGDSLIIAGNATPFDTFTVNHTGSDVDDGFEGNIVIDEGSVTRTITYTGLEPINAGDAVDIIFNLPATDDVMQLFDASATTFTLQVTSGTAETVTMSYPAAGGSLTINMGDGDDELVVTSSGDALNFNNDTDLIIDGGSGTNTVHFAEGLVVTGNLSIIAQQITQDAALTVDGTTTLEAGVAGTITLDDPDNDFQDTVTVVSSNTVVLIDRDDIILGAVSGTDSVKVYAGQDLLLNDDVTAGDNIKLWADRDVIVGATVETTEPVSLINIIADFGLDGIGGVHVLGAGFVDSAGSVYVEGADLHATGAVDSVLIDADGSNEQIRATDGVIIRSGDEASASADIIINGLVRATAGDIDITANSDVIFDATGDLLANGDIRVDADGGAIAMADGTLFDAGAGTISLSAEGYVTLGGLRTTNAATAVSITSSTGAVFDGGDAHVDIVAPNGSVVIQAANGIGSPDALETQISTLAFSNTTSGNVQIFNTGALTIAEVDSLTTSSNIDNDVTVCATDITLAQDVAVGTGTVRLSASSGDITQTAGGVTASGLGVRATGDISLPSATNDVDTLAANAGGSFSYQDADGFTIGTITALGCFAETTGIVAGTGNIEICLTTGNLSITEALTASGGTVRLSTGGGNITQSGAGIIMATNLGARASGDVDLNTAFNAVSGTFAAASTTSGVVEFQNNQGFALGTIAAGACFAETIGATTANGNIDLDANAGNLTVNNVVTAGLAGTVTLNADAGAVNLNAAVSSTTGQIDITGDSVNQNAPNGSISTGGAAAINVTADNGSITMAEGTTTTAGSGLISYSATMNVALSSLSTAGNVRVTADSDNNGTGAITDNTAAETANITADQVALRAGSGIGDGVAPNDADIDIQANVLAVRTRTGDIHIQDLSGGLTVGNFDSLPGVRITNGSASDHITIRASSPLTINEDVVNSGGGDIILTSTADGGDDDHLTISALVQASGGDGNIVLNAGTDLIINDGGGNEVSVAGNGTITANVGRTTQLNAGADVVSAGGTITFNTDEMEIHTAAATVNSASGRTIIRPTTGGRTIDLGGSPGTALGLSDAELDRITAGTLEIGSAASGAITVTAAISPAGTNTLHLRTGSTVSQNPSATITETNLAITAGGAVTLTEANDVTDLAIDTSTGDVQFTDANGFSVTTVDSVPGIDTDNGSVTLNATTGDITVVNTLAPNDIDATGPITISLAATNALFTISADADVESSAGEVIVNADKMDLQGTITTSDWTGIVTLRSSSSGHAINLGSAVDTTANTLELSDEELERIAGRTLRIGSASAGAITVSAAGVGRADMGFLSLLSDEGVDVSGAGSIAFPGGLRIDVGQAVNLPNENNVHYLAVNIADNGQGLTFLNDGQLILDSIDGTDGIRTNNGPISIATIDGDLVIANTDALIDVGAGTSTIALTAGTATGGTPASFLRFATEGDTPAVVQVTDNTITLTADNMDLYEDEDPSDGQFEIDAGTDGTVIIQPFTPGTKVRVGGDAADVWTAPYTLGINAAELANIRGSLHFNTNGSGDFEIAGTIGTGSGTVTIVTGGAILDDNDNNPDIWATNAILTALNGIGDGTDTTDTATNPLVYLDTQVSNLDVNNTGTTTGQVQIANTGALVLTDSNGSGPMTINGANPGEIRANSPLTINTSITHNASYTYTAGNSAAAGDSITINNDAVVTLDSATDASLTFNAGDDIILGTGVGNGGQIRTIGAGIHTVNLNADLEGVGVADGDRGSVTQHAASGTSVTTNHLVIAAAQDETLDGAIGTSSQALLIAVDTLTTDTSGTNGHQFITEADGLTALDVNAGAGNVTLILTEGAVTDTDSAVDITAAVATVTLLDTNDSGDNFGSAANPIGTSVDELTVNTAAGSNHGSQWITEANGLSALDLNAGSGNVRLVLTEGAVADTDAAVDIIAATAVVILSDADDSGDNFGSPTNPIGTSVDDLSVDTSAGSNHGSQWIIESDGLTELNLNAGTGGNIALTVSAGDVVSSDVAVDIRGNSVTVIVSNGAFGATDTAAGNAIETTVNDLTVDTSGGNGNQYIRETDGLAALNLNAGSGNITLQTVAGGIADADGDIDIVANTLAIRSVAGIGSAATLQTDVNVLAAVNTTSGNIQIRNRDVNNSAPPNGLLIIGTVDGVVGVTNGPALSGGNIVITNYSPVTVNAPVIDSAGGDIIIAAEGSVITDDLTINANVTATGGNGNISLYAGDSISLASTVTVGAAGSGDILLSASTDFNDGSPQNGYNGGAGDASTAGRVVMEDGSIVQSMGGDITLRGDGDVLLSRVVAFSGDVTAIADYDGVGTGMSDGDGAIIDNTAAETENIRGQLAILRAATGIGSGGGDADIETMITTLDAINTTSGDIAINEVAGGVSMTVRRAWQQGASGSIALSTERGNITVIQTGGFGIQVQNAANTSGTVLVDANVTVPATDEPLRGNIIVNHVVTTQGGEIAIRADHDITGITAGVITSNGGNIEITADANNAGPAGDRGTIQLNGNIAAGTGDLTFSLADCDGRIGATPGSVNGNITAGNIVMGDDAKPAPGEGVLRLQGNNNTFTGTATVVEGTLIVNGVLSGPNVIVEDGGVLGGNGDGTTTGVINATVTVEANGTLDPGDVDPVGCVPLPGLLTVNGDVTLAEDAIFRVQLNGLVAGTQYDQLRVNGTVDLSGSLPDGVGGAILTGTFATAPPVGAEYRIIDNDEADDIIGRFAGLAEGAFFTLDGFLMNISYYSGTGNDVTLTRPGRYDFDAGVPITTEPFYESVPQGQLYGPGTGAGWVGTAPGGTARFVSEGGSLPADPNTPVRMFRDVHFGQNGVFQVDVVRDTPATTGLYQVTIVSGDYGHPHNASQFRVGPAGGPLSAPLTTSTNVNEFSTLVFRNVYIPPGATDIGQLVVEMVYAGSNSLWNAVINGLDIRPMSSVGLITLDRTSGGADPLSADAMLTDTYTGAGAPPNTLITIAATGGQLVTADADRFYDKAHELNLDGGLPTDFVTSIQVLSDADGNFTFDLQRPSSDHERHQRGRRGRHPGRADRGLRIVGAVVRRADAGFHAGRFGGWSTDRTTFRLWDGDFPGGHRFPGGGYRATVQRCYRLRLGSQRGAA
jgi:fibronectin-binding autotransporter adhesin